MKKQIPALLALIFYVSILPALPGWAAPVIQDLVVKGSPHKDVRAFKVGTSGIADDGLDDYVAFAAALAGGGHIKIPKGRWDIELNGTSPWLIPVSNTWIECEPGAILNYTGDNTAYRNGLRSNGSDNVRVTGCTMLGNRTVGRVGTAIDIPIYMTGASKNWTVEDLVLKDWALDGILIAYAIADDPTFDMNFHARRVAIDNVGRNGVSITSGRYIWLDEITVTNSNGTAPESALDLEVNDANDLVEYVWITNSRFSGDKRYTVMLGNGSGPSRHIYFLNNTITGGEATGSYPTMGLFDNYKLNSDIRVEGNTIDNCVTWCLTVYGGENHKIRNNTINGAGAADSAVVLTQTVSTPNTGPIGLDFSGNFIDNSAYHGVEAANLIGGSISRNKIRNSQRHGIYLIRSNNPIIENNEVTAASQVTHNTWDGINLSDVFGGSVRNNTIRNSLVWARGTAVAAGNDNITLNNTATQQNDVYNDYEIYTVSGTGSGQTKTITDYVGTTRVATVDSAWSPNPDNTTVYRVQGVKRHRYAIVNTQSGAYSGGYNRIENNDTLEGATNALEVIDGSTTQIGNTIFGRSLIGSKTWAPGSIADAATAVDNVTVLGAAVGDLVTSVSHDNVIVGRVQLTGTVVAADTVTVTMRNQTGGAYDPGTGTLRVFVRKVN